MSTKYNIVKLACYTTNVSMAVVANLSPLLFITFRSLYGISYSLLGLLVLINFFTQLTIDLIFSFFSHKFNIPLTVRITPILTVIGLILYALAPILFKSNVYLGLVISTVIFSASGGLAEVLISPTIAAIPSKDPDSEMSKLHSSYAWGTVFVVIFSTVFLLVFSQKSWQLLALLFMLLPLFAAILFCSTEIPQMPTPKKISGAFKLLKNKFIWICILCIFLGGSAECVMAQWSSSYIEQALKIPKIWGDIFGVALFGMALGLGRSLYAKIGKNIEKVLFLGAIGASICYLIAAISPFAIISLFACALTGFCVSMLWPGSLIVASDRFPDGGVFIFAMMAAGGDCGGALAPQLIGIITDKVIESPTFIGIADSFNLTIEQLGMKIGMLFGMLFPLTAIWIYRYVLKTKAQNNNT